MIFTPCFLILLLYQFPMCFPISDSIYICTIRSFSIDKLFYDIRKRLGENAMFFLSRIYELLWHISEHHTQLPPRYRKLQLALKELHLYYADNRKIRYYSDLSVMSEPGFRRLFKEYTGLSPIDYRNHPVHEPGQDRNRQTHSSLPSCTSVLVLQSIFVQPLRYASTNASIKEPKEWCSSFTGKTSVIYA